MSLRPKVVVTGAGGFIGGQLIAALLPDYDIIALSRQPRPDQPGISWRGCDLFSLLQAEAALAGADYAFYLVHSMLPMARLTQGSFMDMDLILADNFARAAKLAGVKQIVYLGGIIPPGAELSRHLQSRLEVEKTLAGHGVPVTNLRASIIMGPRGSSFQMMEKLVRRLPLMLCPRWTLSRTQPIALKDVLVLMRAVLGRTEFYHQSFDIAGPDVVSYVELLQATAAALGLRRQIVPVPFLPAWVSEIGVALITGAPRELVSPLVESLKHPMVAADRRLQTGLGLPSTPLAEALTLALRQGSEPPSAPVLHRGRYQRVLPQEGVRPLVTLKDVRSVQRLPLPPGKTAVWVAEKYTIWLPRFLPLLLRIEVDGERNISFFVHGLPWPLLRLHYSPERSALDRTLFYIAGGLLVRETPGLRGRLEFREVLKGQFVLAAIHDFTPRLPWFFYNRSQALVHLWVMNAFKRYLESLDVRLY
ncbi:MAG: NAD-dependent epimerase/dehydratase family protein [Candidatus Sericytochromatia bacterium]